MTLSLMTLVLGLAILADSLVLVASPRWAMKVLRQLPRNRPAGWILAAIGLAWAAWLLWDMPLGRFESLKPLLFILAPLTYGLVLICMDELLAARALGGILVLVPAPILDAARWHPSPLRLVIIVLAYAIAIKGLALMLSPHLLRKGSELLFGTPVHCRLWGAIGVLLAIALFALSALVY